MSGLRITYLVLAIAGAVLPMAHWLPWLAEPGNDLRGLLSAWAANPAVAGLAWDVSIAGLAFGVWAVAETLVRRNWLALIAIPVTLGIGLGCGLPLYLFLRTRPVV
jgi:hypothetical protein